MTWKPANWNVLYASIKKMRDALPAAPVDTMGCDIDRGRSFDEKTKRFHILVSLMLSSQTKDEVNNAAMERLLDHGLTPTEICKISEPDLGKLIIPVGFWRTKAKHIKQASEICLNEHNSDIPPDLEGLLKLPGVGPKMAYLAMTCAWKKVVGIGVDVHVHRISNRLKWVKKPTKTPEQTRLELESWLPREYWSDVNHMLVGFGQTVCLPLKPKCGECAINNLCPSAFKTK
ncbi:endonuclease III-like protein 1 isoform X2 [Convolutriloba macropyga]